MPAKNKQYAVTSDALTAGCYGEGYAVIDAPNEKAAIQQYIEDMIGPDQARHYVYTLHALPAGKKFKADTVLKVTAADV